MKKLIIFIINILIQFTCINNKPAIAVIKSCNISKLDYSIIHDTCHKNLRENNPTLLSLKKTTQKSHKHKPDTATVRVLLGYEASGRAATKKYNLGSGSGSSSGPARNL